MKRILMSSLACTAAAALAQTPNVPITAKPGAVSAPQPQLQPQPQPQPPAHINHSVGVYIDPDTSRWPTGDAGVSVEVPMVTNVWDPVAGTTLHVPVQLPIPPARPAPASGDVRNVAAFVGINRLDPVVYPGQVDVAHAHALFGLASLTQDTTGQNIRDNCVSTSRGGTWICSAYWLPAMIDTATHLPLKPLSLLVYYKGGLAGYMGLVKNGVREGDTIQAWPSGMVMIAGSATSTGPQPMATYMCATGSGDAQPGYSPQASIPDACPNPDGTGTLVTTLIFPQCWDGMSLDSADHQSHMAYPSGDASLATVTCPADHPKLLPRVEFIDKLPLPANGDIRKWVRSSDMYAVDAAGNVLPGVPRGYSMHGDWMNGIKPEVLQLWQQNCYAKRADCGTYTLGDGRGAGEFGSN
ncbi:MAG TPA: DUF1996 domain-containing protein [Caldimonas sp.]|nr:DUF1996 domain-containing protein [Caldimonas sp.]